MIRRNTFRALTAFCLTLACGVGLWYFLVHRDATGWWQRSHEARIRLSKFFPNNASEPDVRFVPCQMVQRFSGESNVRKVTLREGPSAEATIAAEIEKRLYPFEILGATRDFIHVRHPDPEFLSHLTEPELSRLHRAEGWTTWGEIFPELSVAVLDAETGAIVTRFPLEPQTLNVTFSPDGKRAIFFGNDRAREVLTTDYTTARCLYVTPSYSIKSVFYQPDGTLYAATLETDETRKFPNRKLNVVRVSDTGGPSQLTDLSAVATDFQISGDGRTGFIFHRKADDHYQLEQADVVDLQTLKIRNTFKLDCDDCPSWFTLNKSGSELYIKPFRSRSIWVIDTRTGQRVRELSYGPGSDSLSGDFRVIGDSLYFSDWDAHPYPAVLLNSAGATSVNPLIAEAIEAGDARFNINHEGTRLFRLDSSGNVQHTFSIDRPEVELNPEVTNYLLAGGLTATPDGKQLLLFIHYSFEARVIMDCSPTMKHPGQTKH